MTRAAVHTASGHRLGAADPRQEGPADLRLVAPALATWAAAALSVAVPGWWAFCFTTVCLGTAAVTAAVARGRAQRQGQGQRRGRGAGAGAVRAIRAVWAVRAVGAAVRPDQPGRRLNATAVAAVLLCAAAGAASGGLHAADVRRGPLPQLARQSARVAVELTVTSDPRPTRPRIRGDHATRASVVLDADVTRVRAPDGTTSTVRTPVLVIAHSAAWQRLLPTTRLRLSARPQPPLSGDDRIAAVLSVEGSRPPQIIGAPTGVQRLAGHLRAGLREASEGLAPDARALLPGLVVGDTSRVPPDLSDAFRTTDLTHLLAVSGSNLTLVLALLIGPPGRALRAERGGLAPRLGIPLRTTAVLGGALTLAFVIVCRPDPSVLRAAACGLVTLLAIGTGRRRSLVPALATAVLLLVLYDPWLARSYGFLLSVLATGALLTIGPRWSSALRRRGVPPRLAEVVAAAAAAQAVCAPVIVLLASRVGLVAIPCNLLAELAVGPATVLGFAALGVAPLWSTGAALLARCAGWPAGWIAAVARRGAALPGAEIDWPGGWPGALLLAAVTVALAVAARRVRRHPWIGAGCVLLLLLAVVRPAPLTRVVTGWPPPGWKYAMCDVGQGDATVLAAGTGTAVVIDTGPDPRLVDRCLRALGVTRIPLLLLTHFHADHVAGLPGVLRGRTVGAIETTNLQDPPDQSASVRREAAAARVRVVRAGPGEQRRIGGLSWQVLWPPPAPVPVDDGPNDASVTLLVRTAGLTLLLPGDLEPPAQQALLRAYPALPPVDVLKVAHHGSAYQDPALLRAVRPRLALISCGQDNPYGHPAPRTVSSLRAGGATVLRTDRDGSIAVTGTGPALRAIRTGP
ncbi:ComEC/Rec2 family competence protein [Streptomyces sp. NBC_01089]|uniref:ComEC/Rec2 family competence protein n=1 Tax=Streptomyces sp. NBC_01089 TaxID=2903747 RepID=UPI00386D5DB0|nr:ComEC/Rec2 family competence protein [Streptomyces sp. NBC_01089]